MKIIYKGETKRVPDLKDFRELIAHIRMTFDISYGTNEGNSTSHHKLFYKDEEGDFVSISNQFDLDEAYIVCDKLRLVFEDSTENAIKALETGSTHNSSSMSGINCPFLPNGLPAQMRLGQTF